MANIITRGYAHNFLRKELCAFTPRRVNANKQRTKLRHTVPNNTAFWLLKGGETVNYAV